LILKIFLTNPMKRIKAKIGRRKSCAAYPSRLGKSSSNKNLDADFGLDIRNHYGMLLSELKDFS